MIEHLVVKKNGCTVGSQGLSDLVPPEVPFLLIEEGCEEGCE